MRDLSIIIAFLAIVLVACAPKEKDCEKDATAPRLLTFKRQKTQRRRFLRIVRIYVPRRVLMVTHVRRIVPTSARRVHLLCSL